MSDIDYYQKYLKYKKKYIDLKNDLNGGYRKKTQPKTEPKPPQKTPQEIQQENIDIIKRHLSNFKKILEIKIKQGTPREETHQNFIEAINKLNEDLDNFNNKDNDKKDKIKKNLNEILDHVKSINDISQTNIEKTIEAKEQLN